MGNLDQKISLGDVARNQNLKGPERTELEAGTSVDEGPD